MYQVGLMESDVHIQYFWTALESFTQEELHKYVVLKRGSIKCVS